MSNDEDTALGFLFFFFQAEDGIRYLTVTGVQTCALPILKIVPVLTDEAGPGDKVVAEFRRLAADEKVDLVIGYISSANCVAVRSEEHTSELQSQSNLVCRLLLEKKKKTSS